MDVVNIGSIDPIEDIIDQIKREAGIPKEQQRLTITGKQLTKNRALQDYHINR